MRVGRRQLRRAPRPDGLLEFAGTRAGRLASCDGEPDPSVPDHSREGVRDLWPWNRILPSLAEGVRDAALCLTRQANILGLDGRQERPLCSRPLSLKRRAVSCGRRPPANPRSSQN